MANEKISALTSYTPPITTDVFPVVDVTTGTTKKITVANWSTYLAALTATLTNKTLTSPVINTPTGIVKGDVGLGNVDNTSNATERAATATLTNKRVTERIVTAADDSTAVIDVDVTDQYQLTAMANATTISTTGTPTAGQKLVIRLKDNGTSRALTWDAVFRAVGVTLPTATTISKTVYIGCIYNLTDTKFDAVAVALEA